MSINFIPETLKMRRKHDNAGEASGGATPPAGEAFERDVLELLRLLPSSQVTEHVRLAGKDIDIFSVTEDVLGAPLRIAFECKDYRRPLTRSQVVSIIADYQPLLSQALADRVCIVTRHGIVANAKKCFDGRVLQHVTFSELLDRLVAPRVLLLNMGERFAADHLNQYYVRARCISVDVKWVDGHFDLVYNPFIDFAIANYPISETLQSATRGWTSYVSRRGDASLPDRYSAETFATALRMRMTPMDVPSKDIDKDPYRPRSLPKHDEYFADLEQLVVGWAESDDIGSAIALLGSYGTGKSSFAKRLASIWAERYGSGLTTRMPLLIELREFGSHQDIRGLITHELVNRHGVRHGSFDLFQTLNRSGKFLLILDGFDEMKQGLTQDALLFNFNELNKLLVGRAKVILCGRPTVFASETEQTAILSGTPELYMTHSGRYIQLQIAPFDIDDVVSFLRRYVRMAKADGQTDVLKDLAKLKRTLKKDYYLRGLLSRPVHLPMLAAILPTWNAPLQSLRRAELYRLFIHGTISREMLKRASAIRDEFDVDTRLRFASELATRMFQLGESRSLRYSEITDDLVRPFARPGQSVESTRRDLVTACFLERKPPDILFFGHKSFAEFLVASRTVASMRAGATVLPTSPVMTPEILAFVLELANAEELGIAFQRPVENHHLLVALLDFVRRGYGVEFNVRLDYVTENLCSPAVCEAVRDNAASIPRPVLTRLVHFYEARATKTRSISNHLRSLLSVLVTHPDDEIGVHAYRTLERSGGTDWWDWLIDTLGSDRVRFWQSHRWI